MRATLAIVLLSLAGLAARQAPTVANVLRGATPLASVPFMPGTSTTARPLRALRVFAGPEPMPPAVPSSTSVFHSPQASHLPAQR